MGVFDKIRDWGRALMQRTAGAAGVAHEFKDIFELGGVPAFNQFYAVGIFVWKALYRGLYKPWHVVPAPTIADKNARRELYRLNTAKAVCSEMAGLVWGEECEIGISMTGRESSDDSPDPLSEYVADVLRRNAFHEKMQELIEQALALGGAAIKARYEVRHDRDGKEIPGTGAVRLDYCMADQFVPIAWDNAKVTEGVFISRLAKQGYYYTRLEWHRWDGTSYVVTNELYRADMVRGVNGGNQDILGVRWPLADVFPFLDEQTVIPVEESLFSYFRTPIANNLDDNSPLGMSVYGNALETLHSLDICFDSFNQEFILGKKRIIVPACAVRSVVDPQTGAVRRYFDANDAVYVALNSDTPNDLKITDNTVELRVDEHVSALNAYLSILCLQVGFSAGTFSFDTRGGIKTATEVVSENSKTYKTVKTIQNMLRPMIEHTVRNIIDVAILYDEQWQGQSVASLAARGYDVSITFDDGIIQDRQTNINEGVMLVGAGLLSKQRFLGCKKYGQGLTLEQVREELKRIREENAPTVNTEQLRLFGGGA